jgi:hypothetical protein
LENGSELHPHQAFFNFREQFASAIWPSQMLHCKAFKSLCSFFPVMDTFPININKRQVLDFGMELMVFELFVFITFRYISLTLSLPTDPSFLFVEKPFLTSQQMELPQQHSKDININDLI